MEVIFSSEHIDFILPTIHFIQEYIDLVNNPDIYQFITLNHNDYTYQDELAWINRHQDYTQFTMINRNNGEFIGNLGFNEINGTSCEIGIIICENYQNQHYGLEALNALIDYAFNVVNLEEVTLVVFSNNTRAIQCYRNVGFEIYETIENVGVVNGNNVNDIYMRLRRN